MKPFLAILSLASFFPALSQASVADDLDFEGSPFLLSTAYRHPERIARDVDANGADSAINIAWDKNHSGSWYIEEQRYGADAVVAGIVANDTKAIDHGLRILRWGFAQQLPDGGFDCPDAFHSASFFVEAASHACLLLENGPYRERYRDAVKSLRPEILRAARWMCRPDIEGPGKMRNRPFTHRRYLVGAALGEAGVLCHDADLIQKSWDYVKDGLSLQTEVGYNPERNGFDASYHATGLNFAGRYYDIVATEGQKSALRSMLGRGNAWLASRVSERGEIDIEGNTRTGAGQELGRNKTPKGVGFGGIEKALYRWSRISGDPKFARLAEKIDAYYHS